MARKVQVNAPREGSKLDKALRLMSNPKGATKAAIEKVAHSVPVWALRQRGYTVTRDGDRYQATA